MRPLHSYLKITTAILFATGITGYAVLETGKLIAGPSIVITSPEDGATFNTALVIIHGRAIQTNNISLNGLPIFVNEQGDFTETLLLAPGYNVNTIEAQDKFGRTVSKKVELLYKPKN